METALANVPPCDLLRVVHRHQGSPEDLVTVVFDDIGADDWATGGRLFSDADRPSTRCTPHCTECKPPEIMMKTFVTMGRSFRYGFHTVCKAAYRLSSGMLLATLDVTYVFSS